MRTFTGVIGSTSTHDWATMAEDAHGDPRIQLRSVFGFNGEVFSPWNGSEAPQLLAQRCTTVSRMSDPNSRGEWRKNSRVNVELFKNAGRVCSGLRVHPDGERLIYPLGSTVVLRTIKDGKQDLLQGHTNDVSCLSVSRSGSYIASGQVDCMGFKVKSLK